MHKDYIHRVGRTARAGEKGRAISFGGYKDKGLLKQIIKKSPTQVCASFELVKTDILHDLHYVFDGPR